MTCLEQIGALLKERREELNLSLSDMSEKTKLSLVQLEAIEAGDIQFFIDDLSYLSYFVRYYSNALDIDFNDIREGLDDSIMAYTDSISLTKIKNQEAINKRVLKTTSKGKRAKKSIDFASIGLFLISLLIVVLLGFAVVKVLLPALNSKGPIEPPVVTLPEDEETPDDGNKEPETPIEETPVEQELIVTEIDELNYEISGWTEDEEVTINLKFNNRSWVGFSDENGDALDAPRSEIYEKGDNALVILKAKKDKVLTANVGYTNGNVFSVNDEDIELNPAVATSPSSHVFNFKFTEGALTE